MRSAGAIRRLDSGLNETVAVMAGGCGAFNWHLVFVVSPSNMASQCMAQYAWWLDGVGPQPPQCLRARPELGDGVVVNLSSMSVSPCWTRLACLLRQVLQLTWCSRFLLRPHKVFPAFPASAEDGWIVELPLSPEAARS